MNILSDYEDLSDYKIEFHSSLLGLCFPLLVTKFTTASINVSSVSIIEDC